ncbi:choice-of-anchor P family protein [Terrabacter sp. NPDC080008]|uniref:choice-of-anchor P family protein n=1 Tax=Terrabacter sp. NPDC080008 TaxID=3155176 RepID=UPI00344D8339
MDRKLTAILSAAAISAMAAPLGAAPASAATPTLGVSASAYGSYAVVGGVVRSGPTALVSIGCTTAFGRTVNGSTAAVSLPGVGSVGATRTSASTSQGTTGHSSRASATTAGVDLLGGLVHADTVTSTSSASRSASGALTGSATSRLLGLKVGERSLNAVPAPNSAISLKTSTGAALATVYLNQQSKAMVDNDLQVSSVALRVVITGRNALGLPIGSRVDVGVSRTALSRPIQGLVGGSGYATSASLANGAVASSRTALAYAACTGGSGKATLATAGVPGVVSTGTTTTEVLSKVTTSSRSSLVKSTIAGPRVLGGLISADAIVAETSASQTGAGAPVLGDSSRFVGLRIAGLPAFSSAVKPNTVLTVPGLGRVTLHKTVRTARSIDVVMIEIVTDRVFGSLPTGSVVRVGASTTSVS